MFTDSSRKLGFASRLTLMMAGVVMVAVTIVAGLLYVSYRDSFTRATLDELETSGSMNVDSFMQWAQARQDEMQYLASLDAARFGDLDLLEHLMQRISDAQGYYDTIFLVDTSGSAVAGVERTGQVTRVLSRAEASEFDVSDRDWFQTAVRGENAFSEPAVSLDTCNNVGTVAVPVRLGHQIVGIIGGSVKIDTILNRASSLARGEGSEAFLLDSSAMQTSLREMLDEVTRYAEQVAAAATELTQVNSVTTQGIADQNMRIDGTAAAMNEMTSTVEDVAANTQRAQEKVVAVLPWLQTKYVRLPAEPKPQQSKFRQP